MQDERFSDKQLAILASLNMRSLVRGADLASQFDCSPEELKQEITPLIARGLVYASGNYRDAKAVVEAVFSVLPSARRYIETMLRMS